MNRVSLFMLTLISMLLVTACGNNPMNSIPVIHNEDSALLKEILSVSAEIDELYYEEVPVISHYSGGIKIENTSKVWYKANILKTEQITRFYKNDQLLDSEIIGQFYDYDTFKNIRYYLGPYPQQAKSYTGSKQNNLIFPREQTILWYLDKVTPDDSSFSEGELEGEPCFIVEILKNNLGNTKLWVSTITGLPIKIQNNYNGNISERLYCNFKLGKGSVSAEDLEIPKGALTL